MTAFMMAQTWQFTTASKAINLAVEDASDELTTMAAVDWKCWTFIRQGQLTQTRELATTWADDAEAHMSKATPDQLAAWGRFLIRASSAAIRDNLPGEAADTLKLARVAGAGLGRDIIPRSNPWQVFGPMTVAMFRAQNALINDRPTITRPCSPLSQPHPRCVLGQHLRDLRDQAGGGGEATSTTMSTALTGRVSGGMPGQAGQQFDIYSW
jgi:hypothetical protein